MATYTARMMAADTGAENTYSFDGPDDLFKQTPVRIVRTFMEYVDVKLLPAEHIDYELNAAFKNDKAQVVTALGSLILEHGGSIPFLLMIATK